jgi:uncharacterized repeat protein (TIGR02543 family)
MPIAYAEEPGSLSDVAMIHEVNFEGIDPEDCISQIDDDSYYISLPYDTDVRSLTPIINISDGASITPASGVSQDFSSPVTYTLTAEAGNTRTWKVICIKGYDNIQYKVEHYLQKADLSGYALYDTDTVSNDASINPVPSEERDFRNPITYTVIAQSGDKQEWIINCIKNEAFSYKVEYYQQNKEGSGYTLFETDELNAKLGAVVEACSKSYTGFFEDTMHGDRKASGKVEAEGLVLKQYYEREKYNISFEENGGDELTDLSEILYDTTIEPQTPHRNEYIFNGWFIDSGLSQAFDKTKPITGDLTLYAKWNTSHYTVRDCDFYGNTLLEATYENGAIFDRPEDPTKEGYVLIAWYDVAGNIYNFNQALTSDIFLYGDYKRNGCDIIGFYVPGQYESAIIDKEQNKVLFYMHTSYWGEDVTNLFPLISISEGATISPEVYSYNSCARRHDSCGKRSFEVESDIIISTDIVRFQKT